METHVLAEIREALRTEAVAHRYAADKISSQPLKEEQAQRAERLCELAQECQAQMDRQEPDGAN